MFTFWCLLFIVSANIWQIQATNVAKGKTAKQSSVYSIYTANLAVDGNSDLDFYHGSCSHTNCNDKTPWWSVDLGYSYPVTSVSIANSVDTHGRLYNFKIEVFTTDPSLPGSVGQLCHDHGSTPVPAGKIVMFYCPTVPKGRYIKITKTPLIGLFNCDALILCEVIVDVVSQSQCSPGFTRVGDSCYHASVFEAKNWFQARVACQAMGADLVVLDSSVKVTALKNFLNGLGVILRHFSYIGAHSFAEGKDKYAWIDPTATPFSSFSDWSTFPNQPNDPNAHCVALWRLKSFKWADIPCTTDAHFVCEKRLN